MLGGSSRLLSKNVKFRIYKTIILPVFLYGCEILSMILMDEHGLIVLENRVLRRIFGSKTDEGTGGWRKLYNEELHNLYSSPNIIRMIKSRMGRWAENAARMGRRRMDIGYWLEIQKERDHWEDQDVGWWIILKWILGWRGMGWIRLAEDRDQWRSLVNIKC
jgi:hypothetical protein